MIAKSDIIFSAAEGDAAGLSASEQQDWDRRLSSAGSPSGVTSSPPPFTQKEGGKAVNQGVPVDNSNSAGW